MRVACVLVASLVIVGCGIGGSNKPIPNDAQSQKFKKGAVEATNKSQLLVEHYCSASTKTDSAYTACLSRITATQVCALDTADKKKALASYIDETGDKAACK